MELSYRDSIVGDVVRALQHHHVAVHEDDDYHHRHHQQQRSFAENRRFRLNTRKPAEHQDCSRGWLSSIIAIPPKEWRCGL